MGRDAVRVAVLGASGYAGGELVRLLSAHPGVALTFLGAETSAGRTLGEVHPHLGATPLGRDRLRPVERSAIADEADAVFCALPHGAGAELLPSLVDAGLRVVDLAGDFRLPASAYPAWYGFDHPAPERLADAVYGLPELFADAISQASLVANPGCYPTPVILGLAPLLAAGWIEPGPVLVDGKTGLSGAGRRADEATTYAASQDSVRPYRVPLHQHTPEMERGLELATGRAVTVLFAPHLVPTVRGVLTTCYVPLAGAADTERLTATLADAYAGAPFVRVLPAGEMVDSKRVRGTNVVELQALADPRTATAVVVGAVDNLVKGAAGQAIQNLDLMLGFDETEGLR
jgi:N-acetyl-gamma-glutamyl-phosphate reductase